MGQQIASEGIAWKPAQEHVATQALTRVCIVASEISFYALAVEDSAKKRRQQMNRSILGITLSIATMMFFGCSTSGPGGPNLPASGPNPPANDSSLSAHALTTDNRPASVPSGYIATPDGWFHPSCILELNRGERINVRTATIEVSTGVSPVSQTIRACAYPSYAVSGGVRPLTNSPPPQPDGWQAWEASNPGNIGKLTANWSVPSIPATTTPEVDYYFPGLENSGGQLIIAQPVLAWNYSGGQNWTIASWWCCISGNISHGTIVNVSPQQAITGAVYGTSCNTSTGVCANWDVNTQAPGGSSDFSVTGYTHPMTFDAGGVLESYSVSECSQYSTDATLRFNNVSTYGVNGALLTPSWSENLGSGIACDEEASVTSGSSPNVVISWWPADKVRPAQPSACTVISENQGLASSGQIPGSTELSCNGTYSLVMQSDGNLVEKQGNTAIWSTGTNGSNAYFVVMQNDGNFVVYDELGNSKWATNTSGNPGAYFRVQDDGNLVLKSASGVVLWTK